MDQTEGPLNKETDDDAQDLAHINSLSVTKKKEGGSWLVSIEDCLDLAIQGLEEYTK